MAYINPEKADIYSLGIIAYRLLTGVPESGLEPFLKGGSEQNKLLNKIKTKKFMHKMVSKMLDPNLETRISLDDLR